jgi:hypothetical protein
VKPYFADETVTLYAGDCREVLAGLVPASVDAIVTDPPYELGFMAKSWDSAGVAFDPATWEACLRVLKPGGHLLAFGGTRTYHRMVCAIEDAGFEIRDSMHWIYGSGFPKSLDVSKAIDKAAGATREPGTPGRYASRRPRVEVQAVSAYHDGVGDAGSALVTAPATDDAVRWQGWGTALKPAHEPIVLARKLMAGTVAATVLAHGAGALNIGACRVGQSKRVNPAAGNKPGGASLHMSAIGMPQDVAARETFGRWPANVVLTHQPLVDETGNIIGDACDHGCVAGCPVADMDAQSGTREAGAHPAKRAGVGYHGGASGTTGERIELGDGGASRFFPVFRYEAKAPSSERPRGVDGTAHATVKPLALMRWLTRLATQPGGLVCDPFLGSGTTAEACIIEGFRCVGVELDPVHLELITARLSKPIQPTLGEPA